MGVGAVRRAHLFASTEQPMTTIPVDAKTGARLVETSGLIAVADAVGNVIGFFAPVTMDHADQYADLAAKAFAAKQGPKSTAEVIADLRALEPVQ
jgi:hypothetical protein